MTANRLVASVLTVLAVLLSVTPVAAQPEVQKVADQVVVRDIR